MPVNDIYFLKTNIRSLIDIILDLRTAPLKTLMSEMTPLSK